MRIRRRPPQPSLQLALDPTTSTAPQTPQNAARNRGWLLQGADDDEEDREVKRHAGSGDLAHKSGVARRLALPQDEDDNAVVGCGRGSGGMGARHGSDDGHMRFGAANGHHRRSEEQDSATCTGGVYQLVAVKAAEEERVPSGNGVVQPAAPAPAAAVKDDEVGGGNANSGATKKRRGPAVLLEGSRCSRVNGRGWRCSQPTLVGYSLCEHHLGKGRMRSAATAAAAAARGRLGRTEHGAARVAAVAPAPPEAAEGPSLPRC